MPKKLTQDEVIEKFKLVHGGKYGYSKVNYINSTTKVNIICSAHGEFPLSPKNHFLGQGCRVCGYIVNAQKRSLGLEEFLKRSKELHGDKYDYSKVVYTSSGEKVWIGCRTHGFFKQFAAHHMNGHGCSNCHHEQNPLLQKMTTAEFVEKAVLIHGNKYDYSNTVYTGNDQQVLINCGIHGDYSQIANDHLSKGSGCPECADSGYKLSATGYFYIYVSDDFIGFGISNNVKNRHAQHKQSFKKYNVTAKLIKTYKMTGQQAWDLEQEVKQSFRIVNTGVPGFKTEAVRNEDLIKLLNHVDGFLNRRS